MKQFYVYIHKKPDGTPFYVGKGHGRRAYRFSNRNQWHQNIVAKYGKENIIIEIIHCLNESQAFDLEKIYIKQIKYDGFTLANMSDGGEGDSGRIITEAHRKKLSEAKKGKPLSLEHKNALKGKVMSDKQKQHISEMRKGSKASEETKQKLSKIKTGKKLSDECKKKISQKHLGKSLTEEHKIKLSESHKGHKHSEETKEKMRQSHAKRKLQKQNNVI